VSRLYPEGLRAPDRDPQLRKNDGAVAVRLSIEPAARLVRLSFVDPVRSVATGPELARSLAIALLRLADQLDPPGGLLTGLEFAHSEKV
jgi:hypothetical protein